jgi:hypothetical protein
MAAASFEINEQGVQAEYRFKDYLERDIEILILERNQKKRETFGILAPMGDAAENPSSLPLVLLHDFYFVRIKHTDALVKIDGKRHKLDKLPFPMDWSEMYFTRYSPKPLIATLCPSFEGRIAQIKVCIGSQRHREGDYIFELEWKNQLPLIKSISKDNEVFPLKISFQPSYPHNEQLGDFKVVGIFKIESHPSTGSLSGEYVVRKTQNEVYVSLTLSKGWTPNITKYSLMILYKVARIFKKWPTTYHWQAKMEKDKQMGWYMYSKWERTGRILTVKSKSIF